MQIYCTTAVDIAYIFLPPEFPSDNWRIGLSNYLSDSLGVIPFKNIFWTSETNLGNPKYYECMEDQEPEGDVPWDIAYRYTGNYYSTSGKKICCGTKHILKSIFNLSQFLHS